MSSEIRYCPECGREISIFNKSGKKKLPPFEYHRKSTCGLKSCIASLRKKTIAANLAKPKPARKMDVYDYFILGFQDQLRLAA